MSSTSSSAGKRTYAVCDISAKAMAKARSR